MLNQYAYLVDFGHDVSQYTDLYTDDAIFQPNAANGATHQPGVSVGRAGLEKWITNEWQMRERLISLGPLSATCLTSLRSLLDGDRATASYFQITDNDNGPDLRRLVNLSGLGTTREDPAVSRDIVSSCAQS